MAFKPIEGCLPLLLCVYPLHIYLHRISSILFERINFGGACVKANKQNLCKSAHFKLAVAKIYNKLNHIIFQSGKATIPYIHKMVKKKQENQTATEKVASICFRRPTNYFHISFGLL